MLLVAAVATLVAGCGSFGNTTRNLATAVAPYKIEVVQGNFLEMPFGDDANDLPLVALHEMFVTGLSSLYLAQNPAMALTLDLSLK